MSGPGIRLPASPQQLPTLLRARLSGLQARRPPPGAGPDAYPEDTMDTFGSPELRETLIRIPAGTTINGAIVALCPAEDGTIVADVCIDGPPVP